jgi:hypothetical protein
MQRFLKACAALLGEAGREIFPKQSEILVDRGDTGNFLNLPYFGGDQTMRYAIKDDGSAATLEEFYELYEQWAQGPDLQFPEAPKAPDHPIKDGPPCLQALCAQGVPEGTRNNALFNIGIYLKKVIPIHWDDALVEHNLKYVSPPLPNNEVQIGQAAAQKRLPLQVQRRAAQQLLQQRPVQDTQAWDRGPRA